MDQTDNTVNVTIPPKEGKGPKRPLSAALGGTVCDETNNRLLTDVVRAWWKPAKGIPHREDWAESAAQSSTVMLVECGPTNGLEGMLSAQIVAAYAASMECHRRAAIPEQTFEGREMNLKLALKASQAMVNLTEALQKLQGKSGRQTVSVHHHHHQTDARTQVAVRADNVNVAAPGEGKTENGGQPHERDHDAGKLRHDPADALDLGTPMRSEEQAGEPVPMPSDARAEEVQAPRRKKPRRAEG